MTLYRTPSPAELIDARKSLTELLRKTAQHLAARSHVPARGGPETTTQLDTHLMVLNTVGVFYALLDGIEKETVARAGQLGATYPILADAWRVTRQGARRRWPDAVTTRDDAPLRQALSAIAATLSSTSLQPETMAHLFRPMAQVPAASDAVSSEGIVAAARAFLEAPPPAPQDRDVVVPLLDALDKALKEFLADVDLPGASKSQWQRFLGD